MVGDDSGNNMKRLSNRKDINNFKRQNRFSFDLDNFDIIRNGDKKFIDSKILLKKYDFNIEQILINNSNEFPDNLFTLYEYDYLKFFNKKLYPIMFMTHFSNTLSRFCVLNIKDYNIRHKLKKEVYFIDPSVFDLKTNSEYKKVNFMHNLIENDLLDYNEYISIDYSTGFAKNDNEIKIFQNKTLKNNIKYKDNLHYICALQNDGKFESFKKNYKNTEYIFKNKKKIIAIGGSLINKKYPDDDLNQIFEYISKHANEIYWVHFYGLSTNLCKIYLDKLQMYYPLRISFDSTKYRFLANPEYKNKGFGLLPIDKSLDNLYLKLYMKKLQKYIKTKIIF